MERKLIIKETVFPRERKTIPLIDYYKDEIIPIYNYKVICQKDRRRLIDVSFEEIKHTEQYSKILIVINNDDMPIFIEVYEEDRSN